MGLLRHELGKQKRHIPIRQLIARAGRAIAALKPCFMMSPLSVAQYLDPKTDPFDLLVMDEASQLKPEEALGAIARARQVIVVGDPKQLPPTNFFDRMGEDVDDPDEAGALDGTESILDVFQQAYPPMHQLRWHYRSKHESLIAFSNHQFYSSRLILPPSVDRASSDCGIEFQYVENGTYVDRKNTAEAERVVELILEHARKHPNETLGVVTLNIPQREHLETLLDDRCRTSQELASALESIKEQSHEPFFVKNLENVQGDERDAIIISCTYGRDPKSGKVYQRFGPLNQETGWRRLNVLVTRARRRITVVSSMVPSDIVADSRGARSLRDYLEYARTGKLVEEGKRTGRGPDSEFELLVADAIRAAGYDCECQVGVCGFFIDLGVYHRDRPDRFILGVECDGASYHSSISARDRDKMRQEILEARGWAIHRVWSTDWWTTRQREVERLLSAIQSADRQSRVLPRAN